MTGKVLVAVALTAKTALNTLIPRNCRFLQFNMSTTDLEASKQLGLLFHGISIFLVDIKSQKTVFYSSDCALSR